MPAKNRNYQWLSVILLSLDITGFSGCDNNNKEQDPETAKASLKALHLFFYDKDKINNITQIRTLIKAGADVNVRSNDGYTPLYKASLCGNSQVVKLLLQAGADVNASNAEGTTPLMEASEKGHVEVIDLLLGHRRKTIKRCLALGNIEYDPVQLSEELHIDLTARAETLPVEKYVQLANWHYVAVKHKSFYH